jgi:hypothetical protein
MKYKIIYNFPCHNAYKFRTAICIKLKFRKHKYERFIGKVQKHGDTKKLIIVFSSELSFVIQC